MISGLEDANGKNVEEVMQLEATDHLKKNTRLAKNHRDKRIATVSLPEGTLRGSSQTQKYMHTFTDTAMTLTKNLSFLETVSMYLKPTKENVLSLK